MATLSLTVACVIALCGLGATNGGPTPPKKYVINLDLPEEKRWTQIMLDHKDVAMDINKALSSMIPKELIPLVDLIGEDVEKYLPSPFAREMQGIADVLGVSVGEIVAVNLVYDVTAFCTSIVSQDDKGQIWHSRNLDYEFADMLKNVTVAVDFQTAGKTDYSGIMYAGYVGILTGQRPNAFTITVDERDQGSALYNLIMGILDRQVVPVSFLVRNAIVNSENYTAAVSLLSMTPTAAPVYFIIAGVQPGDAAVITKGRLAFDDIWTIDPKNGRWFEVETNYDHWTTPPAKDNRRDPAIKAMTSVGQSNLSVQSLYGVMATHPVLNNGTTYTVVMSAAQPSLMQAWIWF